MNASEQLYNIALGRIPGIGDKYIRHLISYCGSASSVFNMPPGKLLRVPGIGDKTVQKLKAHRRESLKFAEAELKKAEALGVSLLFYTDPGYPKRLKHLVDCPNLLYFKGNVDLNSTKSISIVGTRNSTEYGWQFIADFLSALKHYEGLMVVSGLAYGIDICAHKTSLKEGIPTIGVMANGMDRIYPNVHKSTAEQMLKMGGLLTENPFGALPDAPKFPERNRIIAGLSDAVIVVEAKEKGGALITADLANSYNIEVFAVPGDRNRPSSVGCNKLIANHQAHILNDLDDFNKIMNWDLPASKAKKKVSFAELKLSDEEAKVLKILIQAETAIDMLSYQTQIPLATLAPLLLNMELNGWIKAKPGHRYISLL